MSHFRVFNFSFLVEISFLLFLIFIFSYLSLKQAMDELLASGETTQQYFLEDRLSENTFRYVSLLSHR